MIKLLSLSSESVSPNGLALSFVFVQIIEKRGIL